MEARTRLMLTVAATLCLSLYSWTPVLAAGLLVPRDGSLPALDIRDQLVDVVIEDGYAITTVEQVFHNPHDRDLEAIYSFPVPKKGAVAEFTMWIDGKPVIGEVFEKKEARRIYEEEKAAGRDAGLTEKDQYKTFDISVSPIRAGQDTRIRLVYLQPAHVDSGIGNYLYPLEEGGVDENKLAFWTANDKVTGRFSFDMRIRSSYPIDAVRLPNHGGARVHQDAKGDWLVHLSNSASAAGPANTGGETVEMNDSGAVADPEQFEIASSSQQPGGSGPVAYTLDQDIVVYWRHAQGLPGRVDLVAHKAPGSERGTFMLTVTPGDDLQPINEGRYWIFVLDISGSMNGKYATLADGVQRALKQMQAGDRFRIILFNDRARELTPGYVDITPQSVADWSSRVAQVQPENSTNLYDGLKLGLLSLDADRTGALVLVTDGAANVGETEQRKFLDLLTKRDVRLFTFIMGNSANEPLLEAITRASNGFALNISNADDIVGKLLLATSKVTHHALHGVTLDIDGVKIADLSPRTIGSLYRGQQLAMFGHYWKGGEAQVRLTGTSGGESRTYETTFEFPVQSTANPEIERLWAYAMIEDMQAEMADFGEKADLRQAITDVALEFSLVTDYTSMLVLSEEQFAVRGVERHNQKRRQQEVTAQQQRAAGQPQPTRVDNTKPMFIKPAPSLGGGGGGGSLDLWYALLLAPLAAMRLRGRKSR